MNAMADKITIFNGIRVFSVGFFKEWDLHGYLQLEYNCKRNQKHI